MEIFEPGTLIKWILEALKDRFSVFIVGLVNENQSDLADVDVSQEDQGAGGKGEQEPVEKIVEKFDELLLVPLHGEKQSSYLIAIVVLKINLSEIAQNPV